MLSIDCAVLGSARGVLSGFSDKNLTAGGNKTLDRGRGLGTIETTKKACGLYGLAGTFLAH
jgi:hypothetical protein